MVNLLAAEGGETIGFVIVGIVVAIIVMILLNKVLDFLANAFPIPYYIVVALIALGSFLIAMQVNADVETDGGVLIGYILTQVVYSYLLFTDISSEEWTTREGIATYSEFTDTVYVEEHDEEHYRPAWWRKLVMVAIITVAASCLTLLFYIGWLAMIAEVALCVWEIIRRTRRG